MQKENIKTQANKEVKKINILAAVISEYRKGQEDYPDLFCVM